MAETTTAPNNKPVAFGKKPAREPSSWNSKGVSNSDGSESNPAGVTNAAPMKKLSPRGAKKARSAIKRGMISEKAARRNFGES